MKSKQLSVRLYGMPVGILEQTLAGKKEFTYLDSATMPVSLAMPIGKESYGEQACEAFFGGLLPESHTVREIIGKRYGVSANNSFALLRVIGHDCAGAISFHEVNDPVLAQQSVPIAIREISNAELYQHIKALPQKPLFMDVDGFRLSLAGVQDKAAVCMRDQQIGLPENECPTTHILKPAGSHYEGLAHNEYFILKIAKSIGLPVPNVELRNINDITFLLVERYDRQIKNNYIQRIHQEDFCQALGILSARKYQNEGGPSFADCFELLMQTTQPAVDRNLLMTALVFNYLVGNRDAHSKNFSLLRHQVNHIRLAPFYDMLCTRVYGNLSNKMGMKIGGKYDANEVLQRHWKTLCDDIHYRYIALEEMIETIGAQLITAAMQEKNEMQTRDLDDPILEKIIQVLNRHVEQTLATFKQAFLR